MRAHDLECAAIGVVMVVKIVGVVTNSRKIKDIRVKIVRGSNHTCMNDTSLLESMLHALHRNAFDPPPPPSPPLPPPPFPPIRASALAPPNLRVRVCVFAECERVRLVYVRA